MLIKWGSIIVDGSGKLGGHVFSKSRGGNTVRTLARATNPQTIYQQLIRSRFTQLSQGWRNLSESERESWYRAESSFSRINRFGDVVLLSGKNLYNSLNAQRAIIGLGVLNIAPLPSEIPKNVTTRPVINIGTGRIEIEGDYVDGTDYVIIGTKQVSNGTKDAGDRSRIFSVNMAVANGQFIGFANQNYNRYVSVFGVPTSAGKTFIGTYSISTSGQRSPVSIMQAVFE